MKSPEIRSYLDLKRQILKLQTEHNESKNELKGSFTDLLGELKPATLAKNAFSELFRDKQVQQDLTQLGLSFGSNMLISYLLGKNKNFIRYTGSSVVQHYVTQFIQENAPLIMSYIDLLASSAREQLSDQAEETDLSEADYFAQYAQ